MRKSQISLLAGMVVAIFGFHAQAAENAGGPNAPLTFYGAEMKRDDHIGFKEFKNYARSHGQANYVISKSPFVSYDGTGDAILASYGTDQAEVAKAVSGIPGGGTVLEFKVLPAASSSKKGISVFKLPLLPTDNSLMGDVWMRAGSNAPQAIEKNVILSSSIPNIAGLFKFVGFSDKEGALVYCMDECTQYDLISGGKTAQAPINSVDAAGIHRSIEGLLTKEDAKSCKSNMTADFIQNVDKTGYYRGFCKAKAPNPILEVNLRKDSGRWKIVNSTWNK